MKTNLFSLFLVLVLALFAGCTAVEPGNDPLVVRSEQLQASAFAVLDHYVKWEFNHRELLAETSPEFRVVADAIRARGLDALESLHRVTAAYKGTRTDEGKAELITWIAVVEGLQLEAIRLLAK